MRVLGLDLETTGLDFEKDFITEVGAVLWCTEEQKPLAVLNHLVVDLDMPELSPEIVALTGLTTGMCQEFGLPFQAVFNALETLAIRHKADYIVAHNGENFDKPMLYAHLKRHGISSPKFESIPWIDTKTDLIFEREPDSRRLRHLALDYGFMNPFEHRAVFDVLTMLKVLSHQDIHKVIEYQKVPWVTLRALVEYQDRELAKAQRFSWEKIGDKVYPKSWVKRVKADKMDAVIAECKGFKVVRIE